MAEQKSIVSIAVILAMAVAGGAFYFFVGTSDEKQSGENGNEAVISEGEAVIGDELAAQFAGVENVSSKEQLSERVVDGDEDALSLVEEQVDENNTVDSDMTAGEPAVLGVETVEPTAETGVTNRMMVFMGLAAVLGFGGLAVTLRNWPVS